MTAKRIVILDSAKEEFSDIKAYVQKHFGQAVWGEVLAEYKQALALIQEAPKAGKEIDELKAIGITHVRYLLIRQTRMVYEVEEDIILIHMFIPTKRDFRSHLFQRLLAAK